MGKWGLKLSEISIGSWMTDLNGLGAAETARQSIRAAYDAGVNFFDCADAYSGGEAEKFLGGALRDYKRSSYVVSSKVFFPMGRGANDWGLSRKHIVEQLDTSLKNMKLDYLDLYFCHRFDPTTPIEETMQTLSDMVEQGKILYYGVSEWSPVQLTKAIACVKEMHLRPISVIQPQYNMVDRYIEDEIVQICAENGIGIVPFSPLAQGTFDGEIPQGPATARRLARDAPGGQANQRAPDRRKPRQGGKARRHRGRAGRSPVGFGPRVDTAPAADILRHHGREQARTAGNKHRRQRAAPAARRARRNRKNPRL